MAQCLAAETTNVAQANQAGAFVEADIGRVETNSAALVDVELNTDTACSSAIISARREVRDRRLYASVVVAEASKTPTRSSSETVERTTPKTPAP